MLPKYCLHAHTNAYTYLNRCVYMYVYIHIYIFYLSVSHLPGTSVCGESVSMRPCMHVIY